MPYDVYKALRSQTNKALKEYKRGTLVVVSQEIKTGTDKHGKPFQYKRFLKGRTAKKKSDGNTL